MATTSVNPFTSPLIARWQVNVANAVANNYLTPRVGTMFEFTVSNSSFAVGDTITWDGYPQVANPFLIYTMAGQVATPAPTPTYTSPALNNNTPNNLFYTITSADVAAGQVTLRVLCSANNGGNIDYGSTLHAVCTSGTPSFSLPAGYTTIADLAGQTVSNGVQSSSNVEAGMFWTFGDQPSNTIAGGYGYTYAAECNTTNNTYLDTGFRVSANGTSVWVYAASNGDTYSVSANGVELGTFVTNGSHAFDLYNPFTLYALPTGYVDWTIQAVAPNPGGRTAQICNLMITGGTGINTANITPRKKLLCLGDSITRKQGVNSAMTSVNGYAHKLGQMLNANVATFGQSGQTVQNIHASAPAGVAASLILPDAIVVEVGTNDSGNNLPISGGVGTGFEANYQSMLTSLLALSTTPMVYAAQLLYRGDVSNAQQDTYNAAIQSAVTATGSSRCNYLPIAKVLNTTTDLSADTLHPTDGGDALLAFAIKNAIASLVGESSSFSDPAVANVASTATYQFNGAQLTGTATTTKTANTYLPLFDFGAPSGGNLYVGYEVLISIIPIWSLYPATLANAVPALFPNGTTITATPSAGLDLGNGPTQPFTNGVSLGSIAVQATAQAPGTYTITFSNNEGLVDHAPITLTFQALPLSSGGGGAAGPATSFAAAMMLADVLGPELRELTSGNK